MSQQLRHSSKTICSAFCRPRIISQVRDTSSLLKHFNQGTQNHRERYSPSSDRSPWSNCLVRLYLLTLDIMPFSITTGFQRPVSEHINIRWKKKTHSFWKKQRATPLIIRMLTWHFSSKIYCYFHIVGTSVQGHVTVRYANGFWYSASPDRDLKDGSNRYRDTQSDWA